jgi:hypothetical protein
MILVILIVLVNIIALYKNKDKSKLLKFLYYLNISLLVLNIIIYLIITRNLMFMFFIIPAFIVYRINARN